MEVSILSPRVEQTLAALYADARENDTARFQTLVRDPSGTPLERFTAMRDMYLPVGRAFGNLLYTLARSCNAKTIVEFGTSFGISTIFLAAAVRDNGGGTVITTEFLPDKAARAKKNLNDAGLEHFVDFRVGDALTSLKSNLDEVDFVLLDGAKELYLPVLEILEPLLCEGAIVASDNTDHAGVEPLLAHVRNPKNGYVSSAILTGTAERTGGHEISIRIV